MPFGVCVSVTVETLDRDVWVKAIRDAQDAEELGAAFTSLAENVASDWLQVCSKHALDFCFESSLSVSSVLFLCASSWESHLCCDTTG